MKSLQKTLTTPLTSNKMNYARFVRVSTSPGTLMCRNPWNMF